jgi:hypothetical protein
MLMIPEAASRGNREEARHLELVARGRRAGMFTERMTITPDFAAMVLEKFAPPGTNRRLRRLYVAQMAREIQAGRWNVHTHQGIAFRLDGILQDGQHRLAACVESGVAIVALVTYGQPDNVFEVLDQGTARTAADLIQRAGLDVPSHNNAASLARQVIVLTAADFATAARNTSRADVYEFVLLQKESVSEAVRVGINAARGLKAKVSPAMMGAAYFLIRQAGAPEALANDFFERIKDGVGLSRHSPILVLREALKAGMADGGYSNSAEKSRSQTAAIIAAWNLWRAGKKCQSFNAIGYTREGGVPVPRA